MSESHSISHSQFSHSQFSRHPLHWPLCYFSGHQIGQKLASFCLDSEMKVAEVKVVGQRYSRLPRRLPPLSTL